MQPIFNELIELWETKNLDFTLFEGAFWLDNSIVKAFDKKGNQVFLYRIIVNDDLTITYKKHSKCPNLADFQFETWLETAKRIKPVFHLVTLKSIKNLIPSISPTNLSPMYTRTLLYFLSK